jgi:hypothetical protein
MDMALRQSGARLEAIDELLGDVVSAREDIALAVLSGESLATGDDSSRAWCIAGCVLSTALAALALIGWALALHQNVAMAFATR